MSKNFDETVRLQSEKRREWIREIREKRPKGIAEGTSSAPRLASSSAASFPGRNECPETHCSLIGQEEREKTVPARSTTTFEIRGKMEERTGWRGQNESQIVGEEEWQPCWRCRDQQRACRMAQASVEKLEHTGPAKKERVASVPQREQLASMPEAPLPKGKGTEPSVQNTRSREGKRVRTICRVLVSLLVRPNLK